MAFSPSRTTGAQSIALVRQSGGQPIAYALQLTRNRNSLRGTGDRGCKLGNELCRRCISGRLDAVGDEERHHDRQVALRGRSLRARFTDEEADIAVSIIGELPTIGDDGYLKPNQIGLELIADDGVAQRSVEHIDLLIEAIRNGVAQKGVLTQTSTEHRRGGGPGDRAEITRQGRGLTRDCTRACLQTQFG
jgi:hypothetical protein